MDLLQGKVATFGRKRTIIQVTKSMKGRKREMSEDQKLTERTCMLVCSFSVLNEGKWAVGIIACGQR